MTIVASLAKEQVHAQQTLSADSTTNATASSRQWKDIMLEKQLRGNVMKSFGFNSDSLNGMAVRPEISYRTPESADKKHRRELIEQAKFFLIMNPNDSTLDATIDELTRSQELNGNSQLSGSPLESLFLQELLRERTAATNRARAELDFQNEADASSAFGVPSQTRDSVHNNSILNDSSDTSRSRSAGSPMFQSLLNPPRSSPEQIKLQQDRSAQFRQLLDSHSSGMQKSFDSTRSGFGKTLDANATAYKPPVQPVAPAKPVVTPPPAQQPPKTPSIFDDSPPRRKF